MRRQKQKTSQMTILKRWRAFWVVMFVLAWVVLGGFTYFFWSIARDLPAPNQVVRETGYSTKIYDRHGVLLYDFFQDQRREPFTIDQASKHLIDATIAVEDKEFYEHHGFDYLTILRIPYYYLTQHRVVGGSTLTQQLTKMMLLTSERTVIRKFRELILSMQIEKMFTKEQILEMYLNEAPYGGNINGANLAAQTYFHKSVKDLDIAQAAMIAGLPQSPNRYSPFAGRTDENGDYLWQLRAEWVLRRMLEDGYILEADYQAALDELDTFKFERVNGEIKAPHFVFWVEDLLREEFGDELVDGGGLEVYTTLDYNLQATAEAIVKQEIAKVENLGISNGAALVLDPQTGQILAMVGSRDYFDTQIDGQFNVTANQQALRQPGSSIKPLVYLAYLMQKGGTAATVFADVPTTFQANDKITPYQPKNYDGRFRGPVSLRESLGNSLNIPAVKALSYVGVPNFLQFAADAGISTLAPTPENLQNLGLALSLGGGEVHMLEMAGAYCSFGNGGYKVEPTALLEVKNVRGQTLKTYPSVRGERIFGEGETFIINDILSDNNARMAAFGANSQLNTGLPIAVKTGTTNSMKDNWTIGWSQTFLTHVWVGNNDGSPMKSVASGVSGASPIWRAITDHLVALGYQTPAWEPPHNVEQVEVDALSGYPAHDGFPSKQEYYVKTTLGVLPDPIHQKIKTCRGQKKIATAQQEVSGDYDENEYIILQEDDPVSEDGRNRYQEGIDAWIESQGDGRYRYPREQCGESSSSVVVGFRDIRDGDNTELDHIKFRVEAESQAGIERIELYRNDEKIEDKHEHSFEVEWQLNRGVYKLRAKAYSRDGETAEVTIRVGVGGDRV